ncbi:InlB B-repeat-containing protein, partial [Candidatus Saccharibacteria bacterium]|nr:InlB B-repeat-containing protein [Candidatus Saccharibacteria bacterium]
TVALSSSKRTVTLTAQWAKLYTYKVTYACNSGSGCPSNYSETITNTTKSYTIPSTAPTRSGYNFKGYLGSDGTTYQPGGTVNLTGGSKESVTLTAQWAQVYNYSVTVNCDSGTGCSSNYSSSTENANFSYNYTISSTVPTKSGYAFNGYKGSDNVTYQPGGTVALSSSKRTVTLTAQWAKLYTYKVTYNCNSGTGCPSNLNTTITSTGYSYTIPSTAPTRTGYKFTGYSGSDGNTYQPGGTVTLNTSKLSVTLTAQWEEVKSFWNITYMQDMTPEICADATTPAKTATTNADTDGSHAGDTSYVPETTLIDYRGIDGTGTASSPATGTNQVSYKVRKLADGNCWMTQNLRLTLSTSTALEVATFDGNTTSWTPNSTTSSNAYNYAITPNTKTNLSVTTDINTKNGGNAWYYPWYAATAGQGTQTTSPTITRSICPKGWRLPLGTTADKSFYNLITTKYGLVSSSAGSTSLQSFPLEFTLSGYVNSGSQYGAGSSGYYWSASPDTSSAYNAYYLYFGSSSINPQLNGNKYNGRSVRCVSI